MRLTVLYGNKTVDVDVSRRVKLAELQRLLTKLTHVTAADMRL